MSDNPIGIDAQIAAVREEIAQFERRAQQQDWYYPPSEAHGQALIAVLRTLEAARAWAADVQTHGLRQQLRQGAATSAIDLLQAVRGEPA